MSSIAGPSSHASASFSTHGNTQQPTAIWTQLRRIQDGAEHPSTVTSPATPVMTTAPTTAPPTPVVRSTPGAADLRGASQDPGSALNGTAGNGMGETKGGEKAGVPKASVVANLASVKTRTLAFSKQHGRGADDEEAMVQTATRIAERLADDQRVALFPDVDTPFVDAFDVVKRLLPYHVFQQPKEDLVALLQNRIPHVSRKGKRKATEEDLLREEIADTKFALECWKRKRALERRLRNARIGPDKRASPDDQAYVLAQAVLELERAENTAINSELRSSRAELDRIEREKRAAAPPQQTPSTSTPRATSTLRASTSSNHYPSTSASVTTPTTATFMPPYRPPYSYSQFPTTQYTYNPHTYASYAATPSSANTTQTPTTIYNPPPGAGSPTPTSAASAQVQQAQTQLSAASSAAIPVQLPVSSLTALAALGIIPVAAASVPPAGQPQPPAVIKSTNGTMLSLEINLSLLQSAQMSGLVLILNALTSRGVNVDGLGGGSAGGAANASATPGASANGSNGVGSSTALATSVGSAASAAAASMASTSSSSASTSSAP